MLFCFTKAIEINPYSIVLLQSFSLQAIRLGLYDYAENALLRLYELLPRKEYTIFEQTFVDLKSEHQEKTQWSN